LSTLAGEFPDRLSEQKSRFLVRDWQSLTRGEVGVEPAGQRCWIRGGLLLTFGSPLITGAVGRMNGSIFPPDFEKSMFFHFLLQSVHRAFAEQNSPLMSQNMPEPEPTESPSEEQLRKIASYMRQRLSDSQRQWLATQSDALEISSEQIMSDVLSEWFVRHREVASNGSSLGDFLPEALEEFVSRHHEEFLPVVAPG
jgi:hypothetical protein